MIKERRKHPRLRIPLEAEYLVADQEEWRQGTIWTLGAGGAALLCEEKLELGTMLAGLHFMVEAEGDLPETRIEVGAEVVNIDRKADFGRPSNYMLGLRFTGLGEQEFELLRQFVFRRLTGSQRGAAAGDDGAGEQGKVAPTPIEIRFKLFDEFVEEVSENLSPSGMFIRAHRPLPPGSQFVFQFQLGEDFSLFQGTAEVVWTRRRSEGPDRPSGMGVRFLKLDLTSQKMVRRLVGPQHDEHDEEEKGADEADGQAARGDDRALEVPEETEPFTLAGEPAEEVAAENDRGTGSATEEAAGDDGGKARLRRRLARFERRIVELESARDEVEERAGRLEREVETLRGEKLELEAARDEAEEARGRAEAEASELDRELETLRPDDEIEEQLLGAKRELDERREQWRALEAELRAELEQQSARQGELQEKLDLAGETEAELERRLEKSAETEAELRQSLEQAEAGEAELRRRREEAEEARDDLERQAERLEEAESRLEQLRQEAVESRREWDATEAELRAQLDHRNTEESELRDRLSEASATEAELRQRLSEVRGARDDLEGRLAQSSEVEAELRDQAQELRTARDELESRLGRVTERLDRMRGVAVKLKGRFNGDLSAAQALEADMATRLSEVAAIGSGLDRKVERLAAARAGLAARLERITEAWAGLEDGLEEEEAEEAAEAAEPPAVEALPEPDETPAEPSPAEATAAAEPDEPEADTAVLTVVEPEAGDAESEAIEAAAAEPEPDLEAPAPPLEEEPRALLEEPVAVASETADEAPSAEPGESPSRPATGAARLVGAARRAVARLGFGRKSAAGRNGDGEPAPSTLEDKTEPVTVDEPAGPEAIEATVRAWAAAWSERRVEDYLSFYSREFEPAVPDGDEDSGDAPHAWLPPLAGMELTLGPISQTEVAPGRFAVHFEQSVESDSYERRTGRTLELVREADSWKIAAESFQELAG